MLKIIPNSSLCLVDELVNCISSGWRVLTDTSATFIFPTSARTFYFHYGEWDTPWASMSASLVFVESMLSSIYFLSSKISLHRVPKSSTAFFCLPMMALRNNPTRKAWGISMEWSQAEASNIYAYMFKTFIHTHLFQIDGIKCHHIQVGLFSFNCTLWGLVPPSLVFHVLPHSRVLRVHGYIPVVQGHIPIKHVAPQKGSNGIAMRVKQRQLTSWGSIHDVFPKRPEIYARLKLCLTA